MTPKPPRKACQVKGCDEPQRAHGLCHMHAESWRRRCKVHPDLPAEDLRPDRVREIEREAWVKKWLRTGRGGFLDGQICPWRIEYHLRSSIPIIDAFLDAGEIEADYARHCEELMAEAEKTGVEPWAGQWL